MSYQPPNSQPLPPQYPQQPYQQSPLPPMPQPGAFQQPIPKKRFPWGWIIASLFIGFVLGFAVHVPPTQSTSTSNNTQSVTQNNPTQAPAQPTATPKPTQPSHVAKWTTVQKFTGNGIKKTGIFSVPDDWKVLWSCNGFTDGTGIDGAMAVTVYDNQNNYIDGAVNATCKTGSKPTTGETEEHQSGSVYLDVNATGDWSLQVQVLK